MSQYNVAVVGATGAVGEALIEKFPGSSVVFVSQ